MAIAQLNGHLSDSDRLSEKNCARISSSLELFHASQGRPYQLALSMGVAVSSEQNPRFLEDLIKHADQMMYAAKLAKKTARSG